MKGDRQHMKLRKHRRYTGLTKAEIKNLKTHIDEKTGKVRTHSKKRKQHVLESDSITDNVYNDDDAICNVCIDEDVLNSHAFQYETPQKQIIGCIPAHHLTLRQIFENWGVSHMLSQGINGDGWVIGKYICAEFEKECISHLPKVNNPPVRLYDMHDAKVVAIIGKAISQHMLTKIK